MFECSRILVFERVARGVRKLECERHKGERVIGKCLECGKGICPQCVNETGDVLRCPECHERELHELQARLAGAGAKARPERAPRERKVKKKKAEEPPPPPAPQEVSAPSERVAPEVRAPAPEVPPVTEPVQVFEPELPSVETEVPSAKVEIPSGPVIAAPTADFEELMAEGLEEKRKEKAPLAEGAPLPSPPAAEKQLEPEVTRTHEEIEAEVPPTLIPEGYEEVPVAVEQAPPEYAPPAPPGYEAEEVQPPPAVTEFGLPERRRKLFKKEKQPKVKKERKRGKKREEKGEEIGPGVEYVPPEYAEPVTPVEYPEAPPEYPPARVQPEYVPTPPPIESPAQPEYEAQAPPTFGETAAPPPPSYEPVVQAPEAHVEQPEYSAPELESPQAQAAYEPPAYEVPEAFTEIEPTPPLGEFPQPQETEPQVYEAPPWEELPPPPAEIEPLPAEEAVAEEGKTPGEFPEWFEDFGGEEVRPEAISEEEYKMPPEYRELLGESGGPQVTEVGELTEQEIKPEEAYQEPTREPEESHTWEPEEQKGEQESYVVPEEEPSPVPFDVIEEEPRHEGGTEEFVEFGEEGNETEVEEGHVSVEGEKEEYPEKGLESPDQGEEAKPEDLHSFFFEEDMGKGDEKPGGEKDSFWE